MTEVRCTVDNCVWWREHNVCGSQHILVLSPQSPLPKTDKFGSEADVLEETPIHQIEESLCYTFQAKSGA
jgi:hypothetical protein